jgi:hypothetical protein
MNKIRSIPASSLLIPHFFTVNFGVAMTALGGRYRKAGAGVELLQDVVRRRRIQKPVVCVQQVAHAERLGFFDHNRAVPAE